MRTRSLLLGSLRYYWPTHAAVVAGVAAAVSVLGGALLVGGSVRASLRALVLARLGRTESVIASTGFFREQLASSWPDACPLIALEGMVTHPSSGRRANGVQVYGVDDRFWRFHGIDRAGPADRRAFSSEALAAELGAKAGDTLLARLEKHSDVPAESLHGRKEDAARTIRLSLAAVLPPAALGEFSLRPHQGSVRMLLVPLSRLQTETEQPRKVNTILLTTAGASRLTTSPFTLEDLGIRVRPVDGGVQVETAAAVISEPLAEIVADVASRAGLEALPVLTYLANSIRVGDRAVPYSLVAALDLKAFGVTPKTSAATPIVLNEWTASDLAARPGDRVTLEYYLWSADGRLTTHTAEFELAAVVPIRGLAADRRLAPDYPGITDADDLDNWDPPFPMNLRWIRPKDEDYWDRFRATPKGFLPLEAGQQLWQSRFGGLTAIRIRAPDAAGFAARLRAAVDPFRFGISVTDTRRQNLEAASGATDFGEYFTYFSFFLVISALLLAGLFFRLGVEQRLREIGLLEAVGFPAARVFRQFLAEGLVLAALGGLAGVAGAVGYAGLILYGLRTWWSGAVGTRLLALDLSAFPLLIGAAGGVAAAVLAIAWTLRHVRRHSPRSLLAGLPTAASLRPVRRRGYWWGAALAFAGSALVGGSAAGILPPAVGFFGAGTALLAAALVFWREGLLRSGRWSVHGDGGGGILRLAFRNAAHRPGRTVLCGALIASATFIVVSVELFRHRGVQSLLDPKSGSGGYPLVAESMLPLYHNPGTAAGRASLNLSEIGDPVRMIPMRLRPGDDASCLNLYVPKNPRILAAPPEFAREGRFSFAGAIAGKTSSWKLLDAEPADGAVPAIADANSITYVFHLKPGDTIEIATSTGTTARLRLVAALSSSIFQSELIISEKNFLRLFPDQQGYRAFLLAAPPARIADLTAKIEDALADYGFDAISTEERLAGFHRVENTYLSTFQTLGALGLVLGTIGLAAVLLRNVLERRRELALLEAVGYRRSRLLALILIENVLLVSTGLAAGTLAALLAIAPALGQRGGSVSLAPLALLLAAVLATGAGASLVATLAALRMPLIPSLRADG